MSVFTLADFSVVHKALAAVSSIHGSYRAVDLLDKALSAVDEPAEFQDKLKNWTSGFGGAYEGPAETTRNVVKGLETAANTKDPKDQEALLQLMGMVISKLTVAQGTRVIAIMLAAAGLNPQLLTLTIKVCALAAQTRAGKRIVESAEPKLRQTIAGIADKSGLREPIEELAKTIGDKGKDLLSSAATVATSVAQTPLKAARKIADTGITFLDQLKPADEDRK